MTEHDEAESHKLEPCEDEWLEEQRREMLLLLLLSQQQLV